MFIVVWIAPVLKSNERKSIRSFPTYRGTIAIILCSDSWAGPFVLLGDSFRWSIGLTLPQTGFRTRAAGAHQPPFVTRVCCIVCYIRVRNQQQSSRKNQTDSSTTSSRHTKSNLTTRCQSQRVSVVMREKKLEWQKNVDVVPKDDCFFFWLLGTFFSLSCLRFFHIEIRLDSVHWLSIPMKEVVFKRWRFRQEVEIVSFCCQLHRPCLCSRYFRLVVVCLIDWLFVSFLALDGL